jgi:hypothetical protein
MNFIESVMNWFCKFWELMLGLWAIWLYSSLFMLVGVMVKLAVVFKNSCSGCVGLWYFCVLFGICSNSCMICLKFCVVMFVIFVLHRFGVAAIVIISENMMFSCWLLLFIWQLWVSFG